MQSLNQLRKPREAADYLGLAESTLAKKRCSGIDPIPFVKCGRSVRYRQADLDAYAEARLQTSTSESQK